MVKEVNVHELIEKVYSNRLSLNELVCTVWRRNKHIKVTSIVRHFYRIRYKNRLNIPDCLSDMKKLQLKDLWLYDVKLTMANLRKYGLSDDDIKLIQKANP